MRGVILALLVLLAVACSTTPPAAPSTAVPKATGPVVTATPSAPRPPVLTPTAPAVPTADRGGLPAGCRPGSDAQAPYLHPVDAYCLLYPAAYSVTGGPDGGIRFISRSIETPEGSFQTFVAIRLWPDNDAPDLAIAAVLSHLDQQQRSDTALPTPATVGDTPAQRIVTTDGDGVTAVHYFVRPGRILYDLSFGPLNMGAAAALDVAALERTVVRTFHVVPATLAAAAFDCPPPTAAQRPFANVADGYCLRFPATWRLRQNIPLSTAILEGDVAQPDAPAVRLSVTIDGGGVVDGRSLNAIVDAYMDELTPETRPRVRQSEGVVDGRRLLILDGVPGVNTTRQAFVVVDERLFSLTMTPFDDPESVELQEAIATIWRDFLAGIRFVASPLGE